MASVIGRLLATVGGPYHQMCCPGADFMVAAGTAIRLRRARARDRPNLVLVTVRTGLDPSIDR